MYRWYLACGFLGTILLMPPGLASAQQPAAPSGIGVVTALQGQATVAHQTLPGPSPLRFKDDVFFRDQIATKERSTVRLLLGGKGVLTVREQSQVTLDETVTPTGERRSVLSVLAGKIGAAIAHSLMGPGEEVEIKTPDAVAAVRGTVVIAEYIPPKQSAEAPKPVLLASSAPGPVLAQGSGGGGGTSNFFVLSGTVTITPQGQPPVTLGPLQSMSVTGTPGGVQPGTVQNITPAQLSLVIQGLDAGRSLTGEVGGIAAVQIQMASLLAQALGGGTSQGGGTGGGVITTPPQTGCNPCTPAPPPPPAGNPTENVPSENVPSENVLPSGSLLSLSNSVISMSGAPVAEFSSGPANLIVQTPASGSTFTSPMITVTGSPISHSGTLISLDNSSLSGFDPTAPPAGTTTIEPVMRITGTSLSNTDGPLLNITRTTGTGTTGTGNFDLFTLGPLLSLENGGSATLAGILSMSGNPSAETFTFAEAFVGSGNAASIPSGTSLTATAPLFTLTSNSILADVSGTASTSGGAQAGVGPGGAGLISVAGTLSLTGSGALLSATDSSVAVLGSLLSSNGGTINMNGTGEAVHLSGANLSLLNGGSLISLNNGASLTASGPALDAMAGSNILIGLPGQGGGGPIFALRGGSHVNWTGGPLVRLNNSSLSADGGFGDSDGTGNVVRISGVPGAAAVLLDATDSQISFGSSRIPNVGPTNTDVTTFSAPTGVPLIRLTGINGRTSYSDSNPNNELVPHSDGPSTFDGLLVVASNSDIDVQGRVWEVCCGDQITTTATSSLIQLTGSTLSSGQDLVEMSGGSPASPLSSLSLAGPLLDAASSTLSSGASASLVSVSSGARLIDSTGSALLNFSASTVNTGAQFFNVRDSGSQVNLAGPLVSDAGSTFNVTNNFLRIADGGSLTSTSSLPLISFSGTTFTGGTGAGTNTGGSLLRMFSASGQPGNSLSLKGPLLSASGGTLTTTDASFVNVRDGASLTTSGTGAALLSLTGNTVVANDNIIRFGPDGTDSLGNPGSLAPVTVSLSGPLLNATDTTFQATTAGFLGLRNQTTFMGAGSGPLISLTGTDPVFSSVSTPSSNFMFLAAATGATPPSMNLTNPSGSLLDAAGTSITTGDPAANNFTFLFVGDGATLTSAGTGPLTTFTNSSLTSAGNFLTVRRSGAGTSLVNLSGALLSASNSSFKTSNTVTAGGCCAFLFVSEGGKLQGSGLDALLQSSNSSFPNIGGNFVTVTPTANLADSTPAPSSITLSGPLMDDTGSSFSIAGSLLRVADGSTFSSTTSLPLMKFSGSTVNADSLLFLRGVATDPLTGLGTQEVFKTGGPIIELNGATPATGTTVNLTGTGNAIRLDTALLNASAPIINMVNSTLNTSPTGDATTGAMHVFQSSVTSNGPAIGLNNSILQVNNGPLLSLTGGSQMTVNGDLASLTNGSKVFVQNGPLILVDGGPTATKSSLTVTGALVNFGGSGNQVIVNNPTIPRGNAVSILSGIPVSQPVGSASISIGPFPIRNATGNIVGSTGVGGVIQTTNGGHVTITATKP